MALRLDERTNGFEAALARLTRQRGEEQTDVRAQVAEILARVAAEGDQALLDYTARFDRHRPSAAEVRVGAAELARAFEDCPDPLRQALELAAARIGAFHARQLPVDQDDVDPDGVRLGLRWRPVEAAGIYVPGGTAAYPSSVLMNAIPARIAGVGRVVMVVPAPEGVLNPLVLAAARIAGVDEIYRVGGAQAIAALAFGTATIRPVDKIVGPGNAYVAEAKRQVFGRVGIDLIAGPSEILVVADGDQDPDWIAADLLSQAEHDELAQAILVTDGAALADRVAAAVERQLADLPRQKIAAASWRDFGAIIRLEDLDSAPGAGRPAGARASRADRPARRGAGRAHPACRRDLPRPVHARGDRRLRRRPQPCPADRPDRPVRLRACGVRLPEADDAARLPGRELRQARPGGGEAGGGRGPGRPCPGDRPASGGPEAGMSDDDRARIIEIRLDSGSIVRWSREVEHERQVAVFDLLERNSFQLVNGFAGPYRVELSLRESNLIFALTDAAAGRQAEVALSMRPFRRLIKDYFLICDSYFQAIRRAAPSRIEAIDMGRRGLHDEGAEKLADALADKILIDDETARRLFTLICVLHIRG